VKRALELAAEEAKGMARDSIGPEHLLLSLLREDGGVAGQVLRGLGLTLEGTRAKLLELLRADDAPER
jgi:ATP-dependent Clp protease ATP-binding subunit ClpC